MKKAIIKVAILALLGPLAVSCQKENLADPQKSTHPTTQNGNTMHDKTASPALARTVRRSAGA